MSLSFHCHFQGLEWSHFRSFKCPDPLCLSFKSQLLTAQAWCGFGNTRQLWEGWWWTGERSYLCDFIIWYLSGSDPIVTALMGSSGTQTAGGIWHCCSPQRGQWWEEIESVLKARIGGHGVGEDPGVPCRPSSGGLWETGRILRKTSCYFPRAAVTRHHRLKSQKYIISKICWPEI